MMEPTSIDGLGVAADQLMEAARCARGGNREAAQAFAADASHLLREVRDLSLADQTPWSPTGSRWLPSWNSHDRIMQTEIAQPTHFSLLERKLIPWRSELDKAYRVAASARVNERERIARELHDTLLQGVQGLMLRLQAVADCVKREPDHAHQLIEQALLRADAVLEEGRDRVKDLRTINGAPLDLSRSFLRVAKEAQPHPTKVYVTVEGSIRDLNPILREQAERIGTEAMSNVFLHAKASRLDVNMVLQHREFALRISDDGIGIDPTILEGGRERHFGLAGMRERARSIPGNITFASKEGGGTEVELVVSARVAYLSKRYTHSQWWRRLFKD